MILTISAADLLPAAPEEMERRREEIRERVGRHRALLRCLGRIFGELRELGRAESASHDDLRAFGAPGECYRDVRRGFQRCEDELVENIERATGYSLDELMAEIESRVSAGWLYREAGVMHLLHEVKERREERAAAADLRRWERRSRLPGLGEIYRPVPQGLYEYRDARHRVLLRSPEGYSYEHARRALLWPGTPEDRVMDKLRADAKIEPIAGESPWALFVRVVEGLRAQDWWD